MHSHYFNKQPLVDNLLECVGQCIVPCPKICILPKLIKSDRIEFDFEIIDLTELKLVTKNKRPKAPR